MTLISRISAVKAKAEAEIDRRFEKQVYEALGPSCLVHLIKRVQVLNGGGALTDGDEAEIFVRVSEQDEILATIDQARRGYKSRIRAAQSVTEISVILAEFPQ